MNKKFLSVVLFGALMAGSSVTFTGCIDNDEPAGIETLRGAKAELLRAKAVVEEAHAANILAEAEFKKAQAAHEQAYADYRQAEVEYQKLQNELLAATNEKDKALFEEQIALAKQRMEEAVKTHEITMKNLEVQLEIAKRNFDLVLQQIAIAKELGSDKATVSISFLESEVKRLYANLYGGDYYEVEYSLSTDEKGHVSISEKVGDKVTVEFEDSYAGLLRQAEKDLYNATLKKSQGGVDDEKTETGNEWLPTLKLTVEEKEVALVAEKEALKKLEEFMESDIATTDWTSQITALEDSIKALDTAIAAKEIEIKKAKKSEERIAADQALNGVKKDDGVTIVKDGAVQVLDKAKGAVTKAKSKQKFSYDAVDYSKEVTTGMDAAIKAGMKANDKKGAPVYKLNETKKWQFAVTAEEVTTEYDAVWGGKKLAPELKTAEEFYTKLIENVGNAYSDPNSVAFNKANLTAAEKAAKSAEEALETAKADWQHAVNAMNGTPDEVPTTLLEDGAKAYNAAWSTYKAAVDVYNTAFDNAYEAVKAEKVLGLVVDMAVDVEKHILARDIEGLENFKPSNKLTEDWEAQVNKDAVTLKAVIAKYCTEFTNEAGAKVKPATLASQIYDNLNTKAAADFEKNKEEKANAIAEAKTVVDTDGKLAKAVSDAILKIGAKDKDKTALFALAQGIEKYTNLANDTYAMALTEDAETAQDLKVLIGVKQKDGSFADPTFPNVVGDNGKFVINSTKIEEAEITAASEVEFDKELAENALTQQSKKVWGEFNEPRMVAPSLEEIREIATEDAFAYKWLVATDEVQKCKDVINAVEDLEAFLKVVEKDFADFKAGFTKQYNDAFGELVAAVDAAKEDYDVKKAALKAIDNEIIKPIQVEQAKLVAKKNATDAVKKALIKAVNNMLGASTSSNNTAGFIAEMNSQILEQKKLVAKAEQALKIAQNALQKAEDGLYDEVAGYEIDLKIAQANFDTANTLYQTALDNLAKAIELIANSVE